MLENIQTKTFGGFPDYVGNINNGHANYVFVNVFAAHNTTATKRDKKVKKKLVELRKFVYHLN